MIIDGGMEFKIISVESWEDFENDINSLLKRGYYLDTDTFKYERLAHCPTRYVAIMYKHVQRASNV